MILTHQGLVLKFSFNIHRWRGSEEKMQRPKYWAASLVATGGPAQDFERRCCLFERRRYHTRQKIVPLYARQRGSLHMSVKKKKGDVISLP
jgi:hypothetical protein